MSAVLFPAPLLSVERLSIQFGTQRVVDDVSFALWPGKTLCIAGESGSGKSLTSLAIMGLLPEEAQIPGGAIIFDNQDLLSLPERQMQLLRGKSVLIITVADIMSAMKETFSNRETSEEQLLNDLSNVDLLVIDEIGVQTESRYEKVIINQIVDRRSSSKRPTGMLTNSNMEEMTKLLGERVMDRMRLGNSLWVIFNWDSYRSRVTGKEY